MPSNHSKTKRASDIVETTIERMILSLELSPGAVVTEVELVQRLGCGRTPLREAMQRLSEQNLVEITPRQGIHITEMNLVDYVQLVDALAVLEGHTARRAAELITQEEIIHLEEILEQSHAHAKWGDVRELVEDDYQFHSIIARSAHNKYLADTINRLHRLVGRFIYLAIKNGVSNGETITEHRQILSFLNCHNPSEAEKMTITHSYNAKDRVLHSF